MLLHGISISEEEISDFCRRNSIRKLSFFGSVLRDDFNSESDIDVLVEFLPDRVPGFLGLARMERELSEIIEGRKVDIRTPEDLSPNFREKVLSLARVHYERK